MTAGDLASATDPCDGVTAVGKQLTRDAKYIRLACRICAELGAQFVKDVLTGRGLRHRDRIVSLPIVMAGGKKLPELDALTMAHRAVNEGASGVDMAGTSPDDNPPGICVPSPPSCTTKDSRGALEIYRSSKETKVGQSSGADKLLSIASQLPTGCGWVRARTPRSSWRRFRAHRRHGWLFLSAAHGGSPVIGALHTKLRRMSILMIDDPLEKVRAYVDAGADVLTFTLRPRATPTNSPGTRSSVLRGIRAQSRNPGDRCRTGLDDSSWC